MRDERGEVAVVVSKVAEGKGGNSSDGSVERAGAECTYESQTDK